MSWRPSFSTGVGLAVAAASAERQTATVSAVRQPVARSVGLDCAVAPAPARYAADVIGYGQPLLQSALVQAAVQQAASVATLAVPLAVVRAVPVGQFADVAVQQAGEQLHGQHDLTIHTQTTLTATLVNAPSLIVDPYAIRPDEQALRAAELFVDYSTVIAFDDAPFVPSSIINWAGEDLTKRAAVPVRSGLSARLYLPPERRRAFGDLWQPLTAVGGSVSAGYAVEPPEVIPGDIPAANDAGTHTIMNSVQCFDLATETPLALADITIDLDQDSVCWRLSAVALNQATADLLMPDSSGRKELAVVVNGHRFEFFVAKTSQVKTVSNDQLNRRFTVTGYSRIQYLAEPYAPARTKSIGTTTAVQAATAELEGTGFTLDWDVSLLPDWSMPNASFSYQSLSPIAVIKRLAAAAGGVVQTDPAADTVVVRPRYAVESWLLLSSDMDATIHESQVTSAQHTDAPGVLYNAVFVSGESEGVSATITRQYTAGDSPASDVTDGWITAIECNTSRGKAELSASGDRVTHTLELLLPESSEPGLLLPCKTVAVQHDDSSRDYRAFMTAVSIKVPGRKNARISQTVTLDQPVAWEDYSA